MEKDEKLNQFDNSWLAVWKRKIAELQGMLKKKDLYSSWQVAQIEGEIKNLQEKIKKNEALKNGKSKVEKIGKEAYEDLMYKNAMRIFGIKKNG